MIQVNQSWHCVRVISTLPCVLETSTKFLSRTPNSVISWIVRPPSRTDLDIPGDGRESCWVLLNEESYVPYGLIEGNSWLTFSESMYYNY